MSEQTSNVLNVVGVRLVRESKLYSEDSIHSPEKAVQLMKRELAEYDREVMCILNVDSKMKVLNMSLASIGTINASLVESREIFKSSILSNAASIIVMHNHPSGDVTPSHEDKMVTKKLCLAGQLLGVEVLDHIIVGGRNERYYSFREEGVMEELKLQEINEKTWKNIGRDCR